MIQVANRLEFNRVAKTLKADVVEHVGGEPFVLVLSFHKDKAIDAFVKAGIPRERLLTADICEYVEICLKY